MSAINTLAEQLGIPLLFYWVLANNVEEGVKNRWMSKIHVQEEQKDPLARHACLSQLSPEYFQSIVLWVRGRQGGTLHLGLGYF